MNCVKEAATKEINRGHIVGRVRWEEETAPEQRMSIRRAIGTVVDELIDGLYPQAGEERDE